MGGDIQVESRPGQGSTFRFEIDAQPVQTATATLAAPRTVTGYEGPRKTILVADDSAESREVVTKLLASIGFQVSEAANGLEALEMAQRLRPDLLIATDSIMPELDSLAATCSLPQLDAFREVPILAISSSDSEQGVVAGADAFVPKPLDADKLLEQVARLLGLEWTCRPAQAPPEAGTMAAPLAEELEVLYRQARMGNMQEIMAQAERLARLDERYRAFADQLVALARNYQSKAVLRLVEAQLPGSLTSHP
jgi:CheY-like chemotaxis protein